MSDPGTPEDLTAFEDDPAEGATAEHIIEGSTTYDDERSVPEAAAGDGGVDADREVDLGDGSDRDGGDDDTE